VSQFGSFFGLLGTDTINLSLPLRYLPLSLGSWVLACCDMVWSLFFDRGFALAASRISPTQQRLFSHYVQDLPNGELSWIGLRPDRRAPVVEVDSVQTVTGLGLEGDHRNGLAPGSGRQVTLISEEYIGQIAHFLSAEYEANRIVLPSQLRRNLVIKGMNLSALRFQRFSIGGAIFEAGDLCHPCLAMERNLGKGGIAAMIGHGGLCLKVVQSGLISVGDTVCLDRPQASLF
jgi:MOSC domain-containing protein YiiM